MPSHVSISTPSSHLSAALYIMWLKGLHIHRHKNGYNRSLLCMSQEVLIQLFIRHFKKIRAWFNVIISSSLQFNGYFLPYYPVICQYYPRNFSVYEFNFRKVIPRPFLTIWKIIFTLHHTPRFIIVFSIYDHNYYEGFRWVIRNIIITITFYAIHFNIEKCWGYINVTF